MHHLLHSLTIAACLAGATELALGQPLDESAARYRSEANPAEPARAAREHRSSVSFNDSPTVLPENHIVAPRDAFYDPPQIETAAGPPEPNTSWNDGPGPVDTTSFERRPIEATLPELVPHESSKLLLQRPAQRAPGQTASYGASAALTVGGSLATVLGLFFLVVWIMRRGMPRSSGSLPTDVLELLGRAALPHRQQMQLIRCGNKLILVAISPAGAETLTEITDPHEVDRLTGLCSSARPNSQSATFRQVLDQFGREPHAPGFIDTQQAAGATPQAASRLRGGGRA